jgi:hypothetical protein
MDSLVVSFALGMTTELGPSQSLIKHRSEVHPSRGGRTGNNAAPPKRDESRLSALRHVQSLIPQNDVWGVVTTEYATPAKEMIRLLRKLTANSDFGTYRWHHYSFSFACLLCRAYIESEPTVEHEASEVRQLVRSMPSTQ